MPRLGVEYGSSRATGRVKSWREILEAAVDVAADVVRVVGLDLAPGRRTDRARIVSRKPGANRSTWASIRAVMSNVEPLGHMAVRPARVPTVWSAARVEAARLDDEDERSLRVPATVDLGLGRPDLVQRSADVDGARASGTLGLPRDRLAQGPVDLDDAGSVAEALEAPPIAVGQPARRDRGERPGRRVEEDGPRRRQLGERGDRVVGDDLAAERPKLVRQGVGESLGPAADDRPAIGMGRDREHEPERRRSRGDRAPASSGR